MSDILVVVRATLPKGVNMRYLSLSICFLSFISTVSASQLIDTLPLRSDPFPRQRMLGGEVSVNLEQAKRMGEIQKKVMFGGFSAEQENTNSKDYKHYSEQTQWHMAREDHPVKDPFSDKAPTHTCILASPLIKYQDLPFSEEKIVSKAYPTNLDKMTDLVAYHLYRGTWQGLLRNEFYVSYTFVSRRMNIAKISLSPATSAQRLSRGTGSVLLSFDGSGPVRASVGSHGELSVDGLASAALMRKFAESETAVLSYRDGGNTTDIEIPLSGSNKGLERFAECLNVANN